MPILRPMYVLQCAVGYLDTICQPHWGGHIVLDLDWVFIIQGSHTSQMRKFKGISRVIKGSTAHFQVYFWKTVVTLLYVNKISSNISNLLQDFFLYVQHSKEVSIIFLKNGR